MPDTMIWYGGSKRPSQSSVAVGVMDMIGFAPHSTTSRRGWAREPGNDPYGGPEVGRVERI